MNKYEFHIYNGSSWIDITKYVETGVNISDKLDESLDNASFTIPYIRDNAVEGIDLSKAIPPYTPLKVIIKNFDDRVVETYRMYTSNPRRSIIKKTEPKLYRHDIDLIESTRILQRKIISDMSITQPKSAVFKGAFYSSNGTNGQRVTVKNSYVKPTLVTQNNSEDITIIDGKTLKANNEGDIFITLDIWNKQFDKSWTKFDLLGGFFPVPLNYIYSDAEVELKMDILINGEVFKTENILVDTATSKKSGSFLDVMYVLDTEYKVKPTLSFSYNLPKSVSDRTVELRFSTKGKYYKRVYNIAGIDGGRDLLQEAILEDTVDVIPYLTISSLTTDTPEQFIYLDEAVDKVLSLVDIVDRNDTTIKKYKLDNNTRSKISNILCPEYTFTSYTVWDALEKISRVVNAIPTIDNDDYTTISFEFLDDIPDVEYDSSQFNEESMAYMMDTYNSSLHINASNVVEEDFLKNVKVEPYADGWMSTRANSDNIEQITEENSSFKVRQDIYRIYKLLIKGPKVKIVNDSGSTIILSGTDNSDYTKCTCFDISNRVVESSEWQIYFNTTENKDDLRRLSKNTKGNHIHYSQGNKYIEGLGFKTDVKSDFGGSNVAPRALIETIFCNVAEYVKGNPSLVGYKVAYPKGVEGFFDENGSSEFALDSSHKDFDGILAQIHYIPIANVRTNLYKQNVWDLNVDVSNFSNEQDRMNDTHNLGVFVNGAVNKLGNMEYTVSGQKQDYNDIPKLGYRTDNDLVVVSRDINLHKNFIEYTLQLSKDFINQNHQLAPNSAYRQYEIPQNDTVFRQDIYKQFIVLTEDKTSVSDDFTILNRLGKRKLIQNFADIPMINNNPLSYGKIKVTKEKEGTLDNEVTFDMPINGFSIANTINLQMLFESNYSAGPQKFHSQINDDPFKYQSFTSYTNRFGNTYSMDITLHPNGYTGSELLDIDADRYPVLYQNTSDESEMNLSLIVNKDAREQYGLNIELPFITSQPDKIRVFPGIAKYNGLIRSKDNDMEIGLALLERGYFPAINQTTLNTDRIIVMPNKGSFETDASRGDIFGLYFNNVNVPMNTYEGYVVYEKNTKDIIFAVKEDIPNLTHYRTKTIWFIPKTHLNDRTIPNT